MSFLPKRVVSELGFLPDLYRVESRFERYANFVGQRTGNLDGYGTLFLVDDFPRTDARGLRSQRTISLSSVESVRESVEEERVLTTFSSPEFVTKRGKRMLFVEYEKILSLEGGVIAEGNIIKKTEKEEENFRSVSKPKSVAKPSVKDNLALRPEDVEKLGTLLDTLSGDSAKLFKSGYVVIDSVVNDVSTARNAIAQDLLQETLVDGEQVFALNDVIRTYEGSPLPMAFHSLQVRNVRYQMWTVLSGLSEDIRIPVKNTQKTKYKDPVQIDPLIGGLVWHAGKGGGGGWERNLDRCIKNTSDTVLEAWVNLDSSDQDMTLYPGSHMFTHVNRAKFRALTADQVNELNNNNLSVTVPPGAMVVYFANILKIQHRGRSSGSVRLYAGMRMTSSTRGDKTREQELADFFNPAFRRGWNAVIGPSTLAYRSTDSEEDKQAIGVGGLDQITSPVLQIPNNGNLYPVYTNTEKSLYNPTLIDQGVILDPE